MTPAYNSTTKIASYWIDGPRGGQTLISSRTLAKLRISHSIAFFALTFTLCLAFCVSAGAQCAGLHAGITAQFVSIKQGYTQPAHVQLVFLLINDSDTTVDVKAGSWRIVIDGVDLKDSDFIFGNGPMPTGGWSTLEAGQYYEFGKALTSSKYFAEPGEHKVLWKGDGFRSSIITIRIPNNP
jgi:hypothetical protein